MLGVLKDKYLLWTLAFAGGFIDTATFVGANELFSAHVTGNFVVFASNIASGSHPEVFLKLLSFPVFALGVMVVGKSMMSFNKSLVIIAGLVLLGGFYAAPMAMVLAMGMQNASHKLHLKGTPTSTVMTGNVTQFFLDIVNPVKSAIYFTTIEMVLSFLIGCCASAFLTTQFGLLSVAIPAFLLILASMFKRTA